MPRVWLPRSSQSDPPHAKRVTLVKVAACAMPTLAQGPQRLRENVATQCRAVLPAGWIPTLGEARLPEQEGSVLFATEYKNSPRVLRKWPNS